MFPEPPKAGEIPNCAESGVLGVLTGIIGNLQANEVIKILSGVGEPLYDRLFVFNSLNFSSYEFKLTKSQKCNAIIPKTVEEFKENHYDISCQANGVNEITAEQFIRLTNDQDKNFLLVDVRNKNELPALDQFHHVQIPLMELENIQKMPDCDQVILVCQTGKRSLLAAQILKRKLPRKNIINLSGGVSALMNLINTAKRAGIYEDQYRASKHDQCLLYP